MRHLLTASIVVIGALVLFTATMSESKAGAILGLWLIAFGIFI